MSEPNLVERVRKLLALADSSNKHEAAAAMRTAQRLMTQHNISTAALEAPSEQEGYHAAGIWQGRMPVWKVDLARALAQINGCVLYSQPLDAPGKTFSWFLVGDQEAAGATAHVFAYVISQITQMAAVDMAGAEGEVRHSYYQGVSAFLIHEMMQEQIQAEQTHGGTALAVVETKSDKVKQWLRDALDARTAPRKDMRKVEHEEAFLAGARRGQLVDMGKKKLGG